MVRNIGYLLGCIHLDQTSLTILDHFMRKVLADVDVLRTLPSADDVIAPLYARRVVLRHWRIRFLSESHVPEQVAEVQYFDSHFGCCIP